MKEKEIYDLEELVRKLDDQGKIKVYTYEESREIFNRINEGLPEFMDELRKDQLEANRKSKEPKNWI